MRNRLIQMDKTNNKSVTDSFNINLRWFASILLIVLKNALSLWLTSVAVLWSAIFIYVTFYYIYIPMVSNVKELHFQFDSQCDVDVRQCQTPYATLPIDQHSRNGIYFARGQVYRFAIELRLPESDTNWSQGMFMIRMKLFDAKRKLVVNVAKSAILLYKTPLLRILNTIFWSSFLVFGVMEESQTLRVTLLEQFAEGSYSNVGPISEALFEIEAKQLQIYSPSLLIIEANLTGLRYYMYYYPLISALFGVAIIGFFLYLFAFFSMANSKMKQIEMNDEFDNTDNTNTDNINCIENKISLTENVTDDESDDSAPQLESIHNYDCDASNCETNSNFDESNQMPDSSSVE